MMPGYLTALFLLAAAILLATGWKPLIIPDIRSWLLLLLPLATVMLLPSKVWWTPFDGLALFRIHVSAAPVLLAGLAGMRPNQAGLPSGYKLICICLLAMIWGSIRSLYSHDPMLHWLDPGWDAPIVCGLLAGIFMPSAPVQFTILVGCAVLGESLAVWVDKGVYRADIGAAAWWDSLLLAVAAAVSCASFIRALRRTAARISQALPGPKGDRQSP